MTFFLSSDEVCVFDVALTKMLLLLDIQYLENVMNYKSEDDESGGEVSLQSVSSIVGLIVSEDGHSCIPFVSSLKDEAE